MTQDRVMLLIDADNVSVGIMEQAVALLLREHGALHVRRAYCNAETALKHQTAFKRLGIKPMVNLAAGKNSTDIALAVDALDLVLAERPEIVVIASSDSDFAPLVQRLREKGCAVHGIGQAGKTGEQTQEAYDHYRVLDSTGAAAAPPVARKTARPAAPKKTPAKKATTKTAAKVAESTAVPAKATADAVLACLPELASGQPLALNQAAVRLRGAQLLSKSGTAAKLLAQLGPPFELQPAARPTHVRWRG